MNESAADTDPAEAASPARPRAITRAPAAAFALRRFNRKVPLRSKAWQEVVLPNPARHAAERGVQAGLAAAALLGVPYSVGASDRLTDAERDRLAAMEGVAALGEAPKLVDGTAGRLAAFD